MKIVVCHLNFTGTINDNSALVPLMATDNLVVLLLVVMVAVMLVVMVIVVVVIRVVKYVMTIQSVKNYSGKCHVR